MQGIRKDTDEVFYTDSSIAKVDKKTIQWLKDVAFSNKGKRSRLCAHKDVSDDMIHEMLIVHAKGTYVPPHKHIGKTESFHIIEGSADIIIFDEKGEIREVIPLGEYLSGKYFYYRISQAFYHTLLITSDIIVFHEATRGPFNKKDTAYASWAPNGIDPDASRDYMRQLKEKVKSFKSRLD